MSVKRRFVIFFVTCFVIGSAFFWYLQKESYSAEKVAFSVMDRYEVNSVQAGEQGVVGDTSFVIWIDVFDENDIPKIETYLQRKLSKEDRALYDIQVFSNNGITY